MLNQTIIRIPLIIILLMLVILLITIIRQDIHNKRSLIIDVTKLKNPEELESEVQSEESKKTDKKNAKKKQHK